MTIIHNTIRKYTLAMLQTFGNLKVEYKENDAYKYKKIPIKYSSREKLNLFDEVTEGQLLSGNYNVLPRSSITMSTVVKNTERQSNKFTKIATTDFGDFFFNAVAYDFSFDMSIMCRGMNEASFIIEQITTKFNPNYTVLINEIPNQVTPTSVPIQLLDVGIETQEYDELSQDIITVAVGLMVKGNFYSPIELDEKIKNVQMYLNLWHTSTANEYNRAKLYEYDVVDNILDPDPTETILTVDGEFGKIPPEVTGINSVSDSVIVGDELILDGEVTDYDNKRDELSFSWVVSGSATVTELRDGQAILVGNATEIVEVQLMISDVHGNTSNLFTKQYTIL